MGILNWTGGKIASGYRAGRNYLGYPGMRAATGAAAGAVYGGTIGRDPGQSRLGGAFTGALGGAAAGLAAGPLARGAQAAGRTFASRGGFGGMFGGTAAMGGGARNMISAMSGQFARGAWNSAISEGMRSYGLIGRGLNKRFGTSIPALKTSTRRGFMVPGMR
jgi:hypothetical protein